MTFRAKTDLGEMSAAALSALFAGGGAQANASAGPAIDRTG